MFFFITKLRETNRTQHITIVFNVNQFQSFYSLVAGIPQLDKTLGRTGQTCFFFYYKITRNEQKQHVTIIFNVNQILYPNQVILLLLRALFFVATKLQKRNKNTTCHKLLYESIT